MLYDVILYRTADSTYLLECDKLAAGEVVKHLRKYALRSKVHLQVLSASDLALFPVSTPQLFFACIKKSMAT